MKVILIMLLVCFTVAAQSTVTARVEWAASINPDVDKVIIVTWMGTDALLNPIFEDSSYQSIDFNSLYRTDTLNVSSQFEFQLPKNGQFAKVGGVYLNTSGLTSPLKASIFIQLPEPEVTAPFKMDFINFILIP